MTFEEHDLEIKEQNITKQDIEKIIDSANLEKEKKEELKKEVDDAVFELKRQFPEDDLSMLADIIQTKIEMIEAKMKK